MCWIHLEFNVKFLCPVTTCKIRPNFPCECETIVNLWTEVKQEVLEWLRGFLLILKVKGSKNGPVPGSLPKFILQKDLTVYRNIIISCLNYFGNSSMMTLLLELYIYIRHRIFGKIEKWLCLRQRTWMQIQWTGAN